MWVPQEVYGFLLALILFSVNIALTEWMLKYWPVTLILGLCALLGHRNHQDTVKKSKETLMHKTFMITITVTLLLTATAMARAETKVYQTDKYGNVQHHLPSYTVQDNGRIVETDKFGNKQYQKDGWKIQGDKIKPVDKFGNVQPNKPAFKIQKH